MFCPECGKTLTKPDSEKPSPENSPAIANAAHTDAAEPAVMTTEGVATAKTPVRERDPARGRILDDRHTARERTRETLHRASTMARGAIEDNVKRVEKIHHVSTVMLEEATYDPSLRFVLVALGLFVVFVILLILSKVMG